MYDWNPDQLFSAAQPMSAFACTEETEESIENYGNSLYISSFVMEISCPDKVGRQKPSRCKISQLNALPTQGWRAGWFASSSKIDTLSLSFARGSDMKALTQ